MNCELCNNNEANVHYKQVVDGVVRELFVCRECAERDGVCMKTPAGIFDMLLGGLDDDPVAEGVTELRCPVCHMRESDLKQEARVGCANCYSVFKDRLGGMIASMHTGTLHRGKTPQSVRIRLEVGKLERELKEMINAQRFEEAAAVRDRLARLSAHNQSITEKQ